MNNKKRAIADREGLESDEKEVEDLLSMQKIEEILRSTYERNICGPRKRAEGITSIHFSVSVESITPCATNTQERTPPFRQPNFSRRKTTRVTSKQGEATGGAMSGSSSQISTPCGGSSSSQFMMEGHDPTIRLS
jgi:hypothetical protein